MTTHKLSIFTVLTAISLLTLMACKTPQATLPKGQHKSNIANNNCRYGNYCICVARLFQRSGTVCSHRYSTQYNQDLKITLQEMAIAKSAITAKRGQMLPTVTANAAIGVSKVGRYTSEGAGNVGTELTPGHNIPTVVPDIAPTSARLEY